MKPILQTPRLQLRELSADDLDFVARLLGDSQTMRFWPAPLTRTEAAAWIERQLERYERDGHGYWLALDRASGAPVGQAGLLTCEVDGIAEPGLGYIIDRRHWRQGLATEAAAACRDWAFAAGRKRVVALIRPENLPSLGVARRLGMQPGPLTLFAGLQHVVYTAESAQRAEHP